MACVVLARPAAESFESRLGGVEDSVDRLIASCQPKVRPPLPSAGRDLVPYFGREAVPTQALADMGVHNRQKKGQTSKVAQSHHRSTKRPQDNVAVAQAKQSKRAGSTKNTDRIKPDPAGGALCGKDGRKSGAAAKMAVSKSVPDVTTLSTRSIPVNKTWAGPSFYNSPAPECLPLPTAYLLPV